MIVLFPSTSVSGADKSPLPSSKLEETTTPFNVRLTLLADNIFDTAAVKAYCGLLLTGGDEVVIKGLTHGSSIGAVYTILCSVSALPQALLADTPIMLFPSTIVRVTETLPVPDSYVYGTDEPLWLTTIKLEFVIFPTVAKKEA